MWHVSISPAGLPLAAAMIRVAAHAELDGVGDPQLGEWEQQPGRIFHLRRRLTAAEAERVGPVRDVRGTYEATKRINAVRRYLPPGWLEQIGENT